MADRPAFEIQSSRMANQNYAIEVWPYLAGQIKIQMYRMPAHEQLFEASLPFNDRAAQLLNALQNSLDPESVCKAYVQSFPGMKMIPLNAPIKESPHEH